MFTRSKPKDAQIAQSWENQIEDPLIAQSLQKLEENKMEDTKSW
jgi:hypothetical protein